MKLNNDECSVLPDFIPQGLQSLQEDDLQVVLGGEIRVAYEDVRTLGVLPKTKLKFPDHVTTKGF